MLQLLRKAVRISKMGLSWEETYYNTFFSELKPCIAVNESHHRKLAYLDISLESWHSSCAVHYSPDTPLSPTDQLVEGMG